MSSKYKNAPIKNFVINSFGVTQKQEAKFQNTLVRIFLV